MLPLSEALADKLDTVRCADLFDLCATLPDKSIDMILCDLPYGTTACSWDTVIPFEPMWAAFRRVIKPRGAIVLTASQPFTSALVMSNAQMFRYEWVWEKDKSTGFLDVSIKPMKSHENILVFGVELPDYFPQKSMGHKPMNKPSKAPRSAGAMYRQDFVMTTRNNGTDRYPRSIQRFDTPNSAHGILHPTQKPVALFEYLIRTYTQPGDVVLDPCVGSGTTAVAARKTDRRYICGDSSQEYVETAVQRLQNSDPFLPKMLPDGTKQLSLFEVAS